MSTNIELVKAENVGRQDLSSVVIEGEDDWQEIDGYAASGMQVGVMWRAEAGKDCFALRFPAANLPTDVNVKLASFEEMQRARHEQHLYPYLASKLGHEATVAALGLQ